MFFFYNVGRLEVTYEIKIEDNELEFHAMAEFQKRLCIYLLMILSTIIWYVLSVGWKLSQNTYLDSSVQIDSSRLHSIDTSIVPVPQHPLSTTSKPEIQLKDLKETCI